MKIRSVALLTFLVVLAAGVALREASAKPSGKVSQHRAKPDMCPAKRAAGTPDPTGGECRADADCKGGKNGRCSPQSSGRRSPQNTCSYDNCLTDADCGEHGLCTCDEQRGNYCLRGDCRVDADCGAGSFCSPSYPLCSLHGPYRPSGYYCHKPADECSNDEDCPPSTHKGYGPEATRCVYSPAVKHFTCESRECPVG